MEQHLRWILLGVGALLGAIVVLLQWRAKRMVPEQDAQGQMSTAELESVFEDVRGFDATAQATDLFQPSLIGVEAPTAEEADSSDARDDLGDQLALNNAQGDDEGDASSPYSDPTMTPSEIENPVDPEQFGTRTDPAPMTVFAEMDDDIPSLKTHASGAGFAAPTREDQPPAGSKVYPDDQQLDVSQPRIDSLHAPKPNEMVEGRADEAAETVQPPEQPLATLQVADPAPPESVAMTLKPIGQGELSADHKKDDSSVSGGLTKRLLKGLGRQSPKDAKQEAADKAKMREPEMGFAFYVVGRDSQQFSGAELSAAIIDLGMSFDGRYFVYSHFGEPVFTLTNLIKPGEFPSASLSNFQTPGVALLLTLPTAIDDISAFELVVAKASELSHRLGARLLDDRRSSLSAQTISHLRDSVRLRSSRYSKT